MKYQITPTVYMWQGEEIPDIRKWCEENNDEMILVKGIRKRPNMFTGRTVEEIEFQEMPRSFFECLRMADGWFYSEVKS